MANREQHWHVTTIYFYENVEPGWAVVDSRAPSLEAAEAARKHTENVLDNPSFLGTEGSFTTVRPCTIRSH